MTVDLTAEQVAALDVARALVAAGVPVFVAPPHIHNSKCKTGCKTEFNLPQKWETSTPTLDVVNRWRPGWALAAVMGWAVDGVDIDPRSGGSAEALQAEGLLPKVYGTAMTPSGGLHLLVAPLGCGSRDGVRPGIDVKGGRVDGTGRGFIYLNPTVRSSKTTGEPASYLWLTVPDLSKLTGDDDSGRALAEAITALRRPAVGAMPPSGGSKSWPHTGPIAAGQRHAEILSYSGSLRSRGVHPQEARRLIVSRWQECAQPADNPFSEDDALAILDDVYSRYPAGLIVTARSDEDSSPAAPVERRDLAEVHDAFRRWMGDDYDTDALDIVLAVAAVEQLDGDPCWLLMVSGSGAAKTETVQALAGAGATVTSTITSEGALLSGTSRKEVAAGATGGLLRKLGPRGVLVVKDFTSILSMNRDSRAGVLAALREVYDGRWQRNLGTDGGRTLTWEGRLVVIGAVTTAWDTHHTVVASLGDRFVLVRVDSATGRRASGRQALANVGHEEVMRAELSAAAAGLLAGVTTDAAVLDNDTTEALLNVADLVTLIRTAVERDQAGKVVDAHAPEAPTRFAKMLGQIVRGALALGMTRERALALAVRAAGDSAPPLRLFVLADVAAHPGARTTDVTKRMQRPRQTIDRTLQELHVLGLVVVGDDDKGWRYTLAHSVDADSVNLLITRIVSTRGVRGKEESPQEYLPTDFPGDQPVHACAGPGVCRVTGCSVGAA